MKIKISEIISLTKKSKDEIAQLKILEEEAIAAEEKKKHIAAQSKMNWEKELQKWSKKHFNSMLDSALNGNLSINIANLNHYGKDYLELNGFQVFKLDLTNYANEFITQYELLNNQITVLRSFFKKNHQLTSNAISSFNLNELLNKIPKKIGAGDSINFEFIQNSINQSHFISEALDAPIEKIDSMNARLRELDMSLHLIKHSFNNISSLKKELEEQGINPFILSNNGDYYAVSWSGELVNNQNIDHPFRDILTLQKVSSSRGQVFFNDIQEKIVKNANKGLAELHITLDFLSLTSPLSVKNLIDIFSYMGFAAKEAENGIHISWET